jgi:hypothetical protein
MKSSLAILVLACAIAVMPCRSEAQDYSPLISTPLLYASIGAMVGYIACLFTEHPTDHYNSHVSIGAGVGLGIGLALGDTRGFQDHGGLLWINNENEKVYGVNIRIPLD